METTCKEKKERVYLQNIQNFVHLAPYLVFVMSSRALFIITVLPRSTKSYNKSTPGLYGIGFFVLTGLHYSFIDFIVSSGETNIGGEWLCMESHEEICQAKIVSTKQDTSIKEAQTGIRK